MIILWIWFLIWFIERQTKLEQIADRELADELFLTGVYNVGDEFKL
jgi:hypothetical protein